MRREFGDFVIAKVRCRVEDVEREKGAEPFRLMGRDWIGRDSLPADQRAFTRNRKNARQQIDPDELDRLACVRLNAGCAGLACA
ncbi:hypothetical protein QW131_29500 [Roseibium salinum]|nr:hypothetical protein [Roseibium salinum]